MENILRHQQWWKSLSPQWRQAFSLSILQKTDEPTEADLEILINLKVLRLAGPKAPHPNCTFELNDLSGIKALSKLEILILSHHAIENIKEVTNLTLLKSLFVFNNQIKSLEGIEVLINLEQLYVQCNQLISIKEIEQLLKLKELYVNDNNIISLEGLTEAHSDNLQKFVCLPNKGLKQKEIIHTERELGIICR